MEEVETLVISDLHLGSRNCNAEMVLRVLRENTQQRVIAVGDLAEPEGEITPEQDQVVEELKKRDLIYVDGNHDEAGESLLKKRLPNTPVVKQCEIWIGGKHFCFKHGHRRFDRMCFVFSWTLIDRIFTWFVNTFRQWKMPRDVLDSFHAGHSSRFDRKALKYAAKREYDVIICGHTHIPVRLACTSKRGRRVEYFNCGTLTMGGTYSYIIIGKEGNVSLYVWCPESGTFKSL